MVKAAWPAPCWLSMGLALPLPAGQTALDRVG
jgi:hypothetical protein